jgi:hypothetical protein
MLNMKKSLSLIKLYAVCLCVISFRMSAQMSGVVTIDNTGLPAAPNYTSFTALATDLATQGINGPLTVNVAAGTGPYNEQVNFGVINGTSATNTITINGNGCRITFAATSTAYHTFMLSGTDYMNVHNLEMVGTNSTYALVCHLWNGADYNSFNTCTITANINTTGGSAAPVSISSTSTSATSTSGSGGSYNEWVNCLISGGYYGSVFYSNATSNILTGNKMTNNTIRNFYYSAIQASGVTEHEFSGNVIERPNQTSFTTTYPIYLLGTTNKTIVQKNHIRNCFAMTPTNTSTMYGIYVSTSPASGSENIIRNNVFSDMNHNGAQYGFYITGSNNHILHNTVSLDNAGSTAGTTYGIYCTGTSTFVNNVVTITRGGNGTKYGLYYTNVNIVSNHNVVYLNAPAGTNYYGYYNATFSNLSAWQAANSGVWDQQSVDIDPLYAVPGADYSPTALGVNNLGIPMGVQDDFNGTLRSQASPDPGAFEIFNTNCFGNPANAPIAAPTGTWCQGTAVNLSLAAGNYTNSGITYQWVASSTSSLGPFTPVSGATLTTLRTSSLVNVTSYYSVIVSCAGGGSTTVQAASVPMVAISTSAVPYFEGFESLNSQIRLPNCSWAVSNAATALTQTTSNTNGRIPYEGSNFAMFFNSPAGTNYFYSNGIQLQAGITYSSSIWWLTESVGHANWTDLSILVGPNQSPAGHQVVASTNAPAVSPVHKLLGGTFTVPTSGVYYIAIRGTSGSGSAQYLSFDNLRVEIPCDLNGPPVTLTTLSTTVCSDKPVTIIANGADTYTWNTGENSAAITVTPNITNTAYVLQATKLLSGCTSTFTQHLNVLPSPVVIATSNKDRVCAGSPVSLSALSQNNILAYSWSNGLTGASTVAYPLVSEVFTVIAVAANGCTSESVKAVSVDPLPIVHVNASQSSICAGEPVTLTANLSSPGSVTYNWVSNTSVVYLGNPLTVNPQVSAVFTVVATDENGCSNTNQQILKVSACTGMASVNADNSRLNVYPNPHNGSFQVSVNDASDKSFRVVDVTGRIVWAEETNKEEIRIDLNAFADGIYYLHVKMNDRSEVVKVIKAN